MLPFPVKFLGEELPEPGMAPTVGEHTEAVCRSVLGYDAARIAALRSAGRLRQGVSCRRQHSRRRLSSAARVTAETARMRNAVLAERADRILARLFPTRFRAGAPEAAPRPRRRAAPLADAARVPDRLPPAHGPREAAPAARPRLRHAARRAAADRVPLRGQLHGHRRARGDHRGGAARARGGRARGALPADQPRRLARRARPARVVRLHLGVRRADAPRGSATSRPRSRSRRAISREHGRSTRTSTSATAGSARGRASPCWRARSTGTARARTRRGSAPTRSAGSARSATSRATATATPSSCCAFAGRVKPGRSVAPSIECADPASGNPSDR